MDEQRELLSHAKEETSFCVLFALQLHAPDLWAPVVEGSRRTEDLVVGLPLGLAKLVINRCWQWAACHSSVATSTHSPTLLIFGHPVWRGVGRSENLLLGMLLGLAKPAINRSSQRAIERVVMNDFQPLFHIYVELGCPGRRSTWCPPALSKPLGR
eukprot:g40060.t1